MTASSSFLELLREHLAPLGSITARRLFGGTSILLDGTIFAFVNDDILYFSVDDASRPAIEAEGGAPFTYETRHGTQVINGYWRAPERLFDDAEAMQAFARVAHAVGLRKAARRSKAGRTARPHMAPKKASRNKAPAKPAIRTAALRPARKR